MQRAERIGGEEDDGVEITGERGAPEVRQGSTGLADRARPKPGEVQTYKHWAKGWCMRANACRFAHPQPRVPQRVPQDLMLVLGKIARLGALRLDH